MSNTNYLSHSPHNAFSHYFDDSKLAPYLFALSRKMQDGHVCLDLNKIPDDQEFWSDFEGAHDNLSSLTADGKLIGEDSEGLTPFVLSNEKLYINRNYFYETQIIEGLKRIVETEKEEVDQRRAELMKQKDFIENLRSIDENLDDFEPDEKPDWQLVCAIQGVVNNLTIVTGGPGTGKTTTVAKILALLNRTQIDLKVALTAPTGKAAMRMKESLKNTVSEEHNEKLGIKKLVEALEPRTMHSLLGSIHQSPFFKHNAANPLDYDVVVIDEASMIGVGLFAKFIAAVKPGSRLIILGDSEQLAPVDAGSLFGDLCSGLKGNENHFSKDQLHFINSFLQEERRLDNENCLKTKTSFLDEHLVRLKKTYRYDQNSKMGQFTKAVIAGETQKIEQILSLDEDSLLLDQDYSDAVFEEFVLHYKSYIEENDVRQALNRLNDCRILCAVRKSDQGVYKINERIEGLLKKKFKGKTQEDGLPYFNPSDGFYHNQPIMVTQNTPAIGLKNGDVGLIRKHKGKLKAFFPPSEDSEDQKLKEVQPAIIPAWETVFAMTIHKSQGSEFNNVLVILPQQQENRLLTRELLYTGVTRARIKSGTSNRVIVQSSLDLIKQTAEQSVERGSGIQERIKNK